MSGTSAFFAARNQVDLYPDSADALERIAYLLDRNLADRRRSAAYLRAADVVRSCAHLRTRAVVVLTAGYAETGAEGRAHQHALRRAAHAAGMRLLGDQLEL